MAPVNYLMYLNYEFLIQATQTLVNTRHGVLSNCVMEPHLGKNEIQGETGTFESYSNTLIVSIMV
jgi:hypothetical protein